jgi:predicted nucleic acid-binding protein
MNADPKSLVFVDTNILVYAYDRSAGEKHRIARQIVEHLWENESGCLSLQILQEMYVTLTRKIPSPLDLLAARQIVADLAQWKLHIPDAQDLLQAIDLQQAQQLSFWEAMVLHSAARSGCAQLLSEDLNPGQKVGSVQISNPFSDS